ncbi:RNA polymerase sigma factor [Eilatimonas milleporae]|uniref:RNA polymerase sigma-70 factor (ECF subfamily) n=1 Tax=Eilatimonas milleporae TaxID=911205 RepID=A0A3M0CNU8_9PROT|nr:sigma-70 family RNA polymerase sigma factor [Eilatimonas milleporae]RMB04943.1 RNA polymerase sigma-70 factor (ECF subfamily) [Eilatimonas milleporae]
MDRAAYGGKALKTNEVDDGSDASASKVIEAPTDPRLTSISANELKDLSIGLRDRFGNGPPDPDDIAQEAYRRVLEKDDPSSIRNLKAFLWRTARNLVFDALKSENSRSKYDFEIEQIFFPLKSDISSPETVMIAREQLKAINELLRTMPANRRRAIMLYRVERLTQAEIARRLKISRTMVSKHLATASAEINALFVDDVEG